MEYSRYANTFDDLANRDGRANQQTDLYAPNPKYDLVAEFMYPVMPLESPLRAINQ